MTIIVGTQGADVMAAGAPGADSYSLLGGNDYASGGAGDDQMFGGTGDDVLNGDAGADWLGGGLGNDVLNGGEGDDFLMGGGGDKGDVDVNTWQNDGNDVLDGGAGNDALWGMGGNDVLTGGLGSDVFYFGPGEGQDAVTDFQIGADKIDLGTLFHVQNAGSLLDTNANGAIDSGDLGVTVDANFVTHIDFAAYGVANTVLHVSAGGFLHTTDFV